jgi:hypothetical protein
VIAEPWNSVAPVPLRGFHRVGSRRVHTFTIVRLRARRPLLVSPAALRRQLRGGTEYAVLLARPQH